MDTFIKTLSPLLINQIAAGEVIERPASIIKELMENAIDAKPTKIEVILNNGGKTYIEVKDNGNGMTNKDLLLCLKAHTTSKIINQNLTNLPYLGFRGEALASIASVAKISIATKHQQEEYGSFIAAEADIMQDIVPHAIPIGTKVQVNSLFFNIPARLKFLRTDNVELAHCLKIFKKLALSNPNINFTLTHNHKLISSYTMATNPAEVLKHRCQEILGKDFIQNSIFINEKNPMLHFYGFISIPTFNSTKADNCYFIINKRNITSYMLSALIKVAYSEVLFNLKHPNYVLIIDINPQEIDVNVNPTKSEVRFKDINFIRHYLISTIKKYLQNTSNQKSNTTLSSNLVAKHSNSLNNNKIWQQSLEHSLANTPKLNTSIQASKTLDYIDYTPKIKVANNLAKVKDVEKAKDIESANNLAKAKDIESAQDVENVEEVSTINQPVLGYAKAQIHKNWILAQNQAGLIIIDQHAAHERIVQEELKLKYLNNNITTQLLLSPEMLELPGEDYNLLVDYQAKLAKLGIIFDNFGKNILLVKAIPAILGNISISALLQDLIYDLKTINHLQSFDEKVNHIISTIACHNSIRSGRIMHETEMNDLLRTLENTKNYAQCSHGRPTFVQISLLELDKLFKRK